MFFDTDALEYKSILSKVSKFAVISLTKEKIAKLEPINDIELLNKQLNQLEEAITYIIKFQTVSLTDTSNIYSILKRADIDGILNIKELYEVHNLLKNIKSIFVYRANLKQSKIEINHLDHLLSSITLNTNLLDDLNKVLKDDETILDTSSKLLFEIRQNIKSKEEHLRKRLNELQTKNASNLSEPLIVKRNNRYCLPIKIEYKNTVKGIIHDISSSGTTAFIEPHEIVDLTNQLDLVKVEEKEEVSRILKNLSYLVKQDTKQLNINFNLLIELDFIFSKALFSLTNNYSKPILNNTGYTNLINAKHPLIDKSLVVPSNIYIGKEFNTIIITGPNTGGKTVSLKTFGLITLLAQSGLFISADINSEVNVFDNIFVDIGDDQSIIESLSTFSSHIKKISKIVDNVTNNSLVLLDELGSSTDPLEGSSLASGIIKYLSELNVKTILTTHYSQLKEFAYSSDKCINASVDFDFDKLIPTFKLIIGTPGKSNAIHIAKRLGLKQSIIDEANNYVKNNSTDVDNIIKKLEEDSKKLHTKQHECEELIEEYNKKILQLETEVSNTKKERIKIVNTSIKEAEDILSDAKTKAKSIIEELNTLKTSANHNSPVLADLKYKVSNLNSTHEKLSDNVDTTVFNIKDNVFVIPYNQYGVIEDIKKNKYFVKINHFTLTFKKDDLRINDEPVKKKVEVKKATSTNKIVSKGTMKLDLRGVRYEEVNDLIDKFIDSAYLSNLTTVQVIHGFGTGVIRKAVHEYLKKSSYIKSYRYGEENEGLNGCTVVTLK
ncbi:MAG: endonuclease MutS2 [Anaeroplasmataceae bacterium]